MKIMVTGANGQVGFCLKQELINQQKNFIALTKNELDISDMFAVSHYCNEYRPNIIINAAAYTAVDKAESDKETAQKINCEGVKNLAIAARKINAAIFHISTDYVFSGNSERPYTENDETAPQGVYGQTKLEGEMAVIKNNPNHIIMRTAWVFGEHGNNFVKTMLRLAQTRDTLGIVADQQGGPTHAGDIAKALLTIASLYEKNRDLPWGIYNYSGMPHTNWFLFASEIFSRANEKKLLHNGVPKLNAITTTDYPTPAKRPANSKLDCQKIIDVFGVAPSDWRSALNNISAYSS